MCPWIRKNKLKNYKRHYKPEKQQMPVPISSFKQEGDDKNSQKRPNQMGIVHPKGIPAGVFPEFKALKTSIYIIKGIRKIVAVNIVGHIE